MFVCDEHFEKAHLPIIVTQSGIAIIVSDLQSKKIYLSISVTPFGIVIFVSDELPEKVEESILVKSFGMIIDLISWCSKNVLLFNTLIVSGSSFPINLVFPKKKYVFQ